jgi:hypothetical protein
MRYANARFCELVLAYQQTVLEADQEVEDGLIIFLRQQDRSRLLGESVDAAQKAVKIVVAQFEKGSVDFNRYATIAQNLVTQQDSAAQARGDSAKGLIQVYRALGGGWEIRNQPEGELIEETAATLPADSEVLPPTPGDPSGGKLRAAPKVPEFPEQVPVPKPAAARKSVKASKPATTPKSVDPEPGRPLERGDHDDEASIALRPE